MAACDILYTEYRKRQIFIDTQGDFAKAADLIWQSQNFFLRPCLFPSQRFSTGRFVKPFRQVQQKSGQQRVGQQEELKLLAAAFFMIERFASSNTERIIEESLVRGALLVKWPITTLSIGPGQIKPHSILKLSPGQNSFAQNRSVIHSLLISCEALQLGTQMLHAVYQKREDRPTFLSQKIVFALAREYNGQRNSESHQKETHTALLAHQAYNHLAYHLFQRLRFLFYLEKP